MRHTAGLIVLCLAGLAHAEPAVPLLSVSPAPGGQVIGVPASALPWLVLLPFVPALLLGFTAFVRIAVVLFLLRQGLGAGQSLPNTVLVGLAILLTGVAMLPVWQTVDREAYTPFQAGEIGFDEARTRAAEPLKAFMVRQARSEDLAFFAERTPGLDPAQAAEWPLAVLAPAFLTSELKTAFQIAFMVILPFLVIDLVVAAVLVALGMVMLPPQLVSLPLKLLLFVAVDGWHLLVAGLVSGF